MVFERIADAHEAARCIRFDLGADPTDPLSRRLLLTDEARDLDARVRPGGWARRDSRHVLHLNSVGDVSVPSHGVGVATGAEKREHLESAQHARFYTERAGRTRFGGRSANTIGLRWRGAHDD